LQKLQPVQQSVDVGRVFTNLKLAQPNKSAYPTIYAFSQQSIKLGFYWATQALNNTRFNPPFSRDKRVSA
jgi:hypothetical protein